MDLCCLLNLTLMACPDVMLDIICQSWPPELVKKGSEGTVEALVSEAVVGFMDCGAALGNWEDELVLSLGLPAPKSAIEHKETFGLLGDWVLCGWQCAAVDAG
jgi:hypothetical protein